MSSDETVRVEPAPLRQIGIALADIGDGLRHDSGNAARQFREAPGTGWSALAVTETLGKLWRSHLSGLGSAVSDHGDRLSRTADAYHNRDADAAKALGSALSGCSGRGPRRGGR